MTLRSLSWVYKTKEVLTIEKKRQQLFIKNNTTVSHQYKHAYKLNTCSHIICIHSFLLFCHRICPDQKLFFFCECFFSPLTFHCPWWTACSHGLMKPLGEVCLMPFVQSWCTVPPLGGPKGCHPAYHWNLMSLWVNEGGRGKGGESL